MNTGKSCCRAVVVGSNSDLEWQADSPDDATEPAAPSLRFITISHPSQARASRSRKTVRSHVTKLQHRKAWGGQFGKADGQLVGRSSPSEGSTDSDEPGAINFPANKKSLAIRPNIPQAAHFSVPQDHRRKAPSTGGNDDVSSPSSISRQITISRSQPFRTHDPRSDWTVDIPFLIDQCKFYTFERLCHYS